MVYRPTFIDLVGRRFGKLVVAMLLPLEKGKQRRWECLCDCGKVCDAYGSNLRSGGVKSCGCVKVSHGMWHSPTYKVWAAMKQRCNLPSHKSYHRYGGRGIKICAEWERFECFLDDMGEQPLGLQLDRVDNDGDYCKENCRWTTRQIQTTNTSKNINITINGETCCLSEWSRRYKISCSCIQKRIAKGMASEAAVTTPPNPKFQRSVCH